MEIHGALCGARLKCLEARNRFVKESSLVKIAQLVRSPEINRTDASGFDRHTLRVWIATRYQRNDT